MSFFERKAVSTVSTMAAAAGFVLFAPSAVEASFGDQTLRQGMDHPDVVALQEVLKEKGYFTHHTATGYFGEITLKAVRDFQRDHQLQTDGIVGPLTFNKLNQTQAVKSAVSPPASNPAPAASPAKNTANTAPAAEKTIQDIPASHTLREGSRGNSVTLLQQALKQMGFFDYATATGYYGTITKRSVTRYQRARNLSVDGIAGPQTLRAINQDLAAGNGVAVSNPSKPQKVSSEVSVIILREGATGQDVTKLQNRLKELGYFNQSVTGTYGPQTKEAVVTFQRSNSLTVDGISGPNTFEALKTAAPKKVEKPKVEEPKEKTSQPAQTFTLKEGSSGNEVRELQNRLKATGHYTHNVTGYFGPITKTSVQRFQKQWSLVDDGIVTQSTWDQLIEVSSVHMEHAQPDSGTPSNFNVMNLIADAADQLGVPYQWGGVNPDGFDCSGFIQYVFKQNGVTLPRTVAEQWSVMESVTDLKPGDLVFFETYAKGPSHNGIYIGNNQFIHSGSSTGVTVSNLSTNYWDTRYLGAKRIRQ